MRVAAGVAALAGVGVVAGCGGGEPTGSGAAKPTSTVTATTAAERAERQTKKASIETTCKRAEVAGYRFCEQIRVRGDRLLGFAGATLEIRDGEAWRVVAREPRGALRGGVEWGAWGAVWRSPDGRTLLAEWAAECDTHYAFFVPAAGGRPRPVRGERSWRRSPPSLARGWASDGRARVWVLAGGGCSHRARVQAGRYLVDPHGDVFDYAGPLPKPYGS